MKFKLNLSQLETRENPDGGGGYELPLYPGGPSQPTNPNPPSQPQNPGRPDPGPAEPLPSGG